MADPPRSPLGTFARELFAPIGGDYDRVAAILSFGQDPRWRSALVRGCPVAPDAHTLDLATGTAAVAIAMATRYGCRVTGLDQSAEMLSSGRARVSKAGLEGRIELVEGRAQELPYEADTFDAVTATYFLRYVDDVPAAIGELVRVAKPGAPVGYLDFGVPPLPPARLAWEGYTRAGLPLAGRAIGHGWLEVGRFLHGSIRRFGDDYPPARLGDLFGQAGVVDLRVRRMSLGGGTVVTGRRATAGSAR
jgi:demethylmenaquinone methyltransferase/2-methoxy-6-polyprenyl-1,4-benzoquinol methylase